MPLEARILAIEVVGGVLEVRLDRGSDDRVDKGWVGEVLDEAGKPVPSATGASVAWQGSRAGSA